MRERSDEKIILGEGNEDIGELEKKKCEKRIVELRNGILKRRIGLREKKNIIVGWMELIMREKRGIRNEEWEGNDIWKLKKIKKLKDLRWENKFRESWK